MGAIRRSDERVEDGGTRGELEVFPTGRTVVVAPDATGITHDAPTFGERLRQGGSSVRDGLGQARDFHAAPGPRPGAVPIPAVTSTRAGGGTDIVRPVLVDPLTACRLATSGELFSPPIPHLRVDGPGDRATLTWDAAVVSGRRREQRATLHLMASPSMVVTVIELVPCRRIRRRRSRFVAEGIAVVEELAHRLEAVGAQRSGSGSGSACTTDSR